MLKNMGRLAKEASYRLMTADSKLKSAALFAVADALKTRANEIIEENKKDVDSFVKKGGTAAMADRLSLDESRIYAMADGVRKVEALADPIGEIEKAVKRPNGLLIGKKRVPIGVIGIIYEARPNVTADAAALCLKTSNACILRGGSEAINSNKKIVEVINDALNSVGFPENAVQLVEDTSRETAKELMRLSEYLDVLIPRGGKGLIRSVVENATVPVIETGTGNCHIYVEKTADLKMAENILVNAKVSRPSVCNAAESLLVDEAVAEKFLPEAQKALKPYNVEIRGCEKTLKILNNIKPASEEDFYTEYNDYIISVKVVKNINEAISHINKCGTGHSEAIITKDYNASNRFLEEVDAAAVYVNASTRFTDGFEFGFGAEIGISTQKLHARGPMGLNELTSIKYVIYGDGQTRG